MPIGKGNIHANKANKPTPTEHLYAEAAFKPGEMPPKPFDSLEFIMRFEQGELDDQELVEGFQNMIDSGLVWALQGFYGRMAMRLIEQGYCHS